MPVTTLTDLTLKNIAPIDKQLQYWDASLPCFGCRVSPRGTKTFNVMIGKERRLVKIGNYPGMSLGEARRRAHELIDADKDPHRITFPAAREQFIEHHLETLKPTTAREQTHIINRFPFDKQLSQVTLGEITRFLGSLSPGSARTSYNVLRTFLNWCVANDYLDRSPLRKSPYMSIGAEL